MGDEVLNVNQRDRLIKYSNGIYEQRVGHAVPDDVDFKLMISRDLLLQLLDVPTVEKMEKIIGNYDSIVLRRVTSQRRILDWHTDTISKSMGISLNDDYE